LWYAFLVIAGQSLGQSVDAVRKAVEDVNRVLGVAAVVVTVLFGAWLWERTRRRRRAKR
jgi:membrane protein DedA with SNARE-associated domain